MKVVVIHSGGMDSSICLALAIEEFGADEVHSLSFSYQQRHENEVVQAAKICKEWGVQHSILPIQFMGNNALTNHEVPIEGLNTLVVGRNGLMARVGGIHAHNSGAMRIDLGVMELEEANSGYRDCNRKYMDLIQEALRIDFADPTFSIHTPLIQMTKCETMDVAKRLGVLDFLLEETITCYEGIPREGCRKCPACLLRQEGLDQFIKRGAGSLRSY